MKIAKSAAKFRVLLGGEGLGFSKIFGIFHPLLTVVEAGPAAIPVGAQQGAGDEAADHLWKTKKTLGLTPWENFRVFFGRLTCKILMMPRLVLRYPVFRFAIAERFRERLVESFFAENRKKFITRKQRKVEKFRSGLGWCEGIRIGPH